MRLRIGKDIVVFNLALDILLECILVLRLILHLESYTLSHVVYLLLLAPVIIDTMIDIRLVGGVDACS